MSYALEEARQLDRSALAFLKGKKAAVQYEQRQNGAIEVLHIEAIHFNKAGDTHLTLASRFVLAY